MVSIKYLLPYAIGCMCLSSCFCHKVRPSAILLALVVTIFFISTALCARHGTSVNISFIKLKSVSCSGPHFHGSFLFGHRLSRYLGSESFGKCFAIYCMAPRNDIPLCFPVIFRMLLLSLCSVLSRFHRSLLGAIPFCSQKVQFFSCSLYILLLQLIQNVEQFLFVFLFSPGLVLCCRLAMRVYNILMFDRFFLGKLSVNLRD